MEESGCCLCLRVIAFRSADIILSLDTMNVTNRARVRLYPARLHGYKDSRSSTNVISGGNFRPQSELYDRTEIYSFKREIRLWAAKV